jgi:hypothetical protein
MTRRVDKRLTARLKKHWERIRKGRALPEMARFNPGPVDDLWPQCFLVSVDGRGQRLLYKYEYMGEELVALYGRDLTGCYTDERMAQFPGAIVCRGLGPAAMYRQALEEDGFFVNDHGRLVKYRACFLPFGSEAKGVTHIVVGLSGRVF